MSVYRARSGDIGELRLAELLGALSHALDMVEGQPRWALRAMLLDWDAYRPSHRP